MKEDVGFFGKIPRDGISRECFERLLKCVLLLEVDILLLYVLGITWFVVVQVLAGIVLLILILIELISLAIHTKELLEYEQETRENSAIVGAPKASKIWLTIFWVRMSVVVLFLLMVGMGIINLTTVLSMQLVEHIKEDQSMLVNFMGHAEFKHKAPANYPIIREGDEAPIRIYERVFIDKGERREVKLRALRVEVEDEKLVTYEELERKRAGGP